MDGVGFCSKHCFSIFDVSARLASGVLGVPFVLPARGIALLDSGATRLFCISRTLPSVLADITRSLALLALLPTT
jgi:hypothetical protein